MGRLVTFLFSTSPRFGLTVGSIGVFSFASTRYKDRNRCTF